jgi:hypothetical protein
MRLSFGNVTELVMIFSECLRSLTPHVKKVGIEWEEGKNYDDWDAIAQTLYSAVVGSTIAYTVEGRGFRGLAPYALIMPDYSELSFLFCIQSKQLPFLRLERSERPFDSAVFLELDAEGKPTGGRTRKLLRDCQLSALLRSSTEQREIVDVVAEEK